MGMFIVVREPVPTAAPRDRRYREIEVGQFVYHPGKRARSLYELLSGRIVLLVNEREGHKVAYALIQAGETFGEECLFHDCRRLHSAYAYRESAFVHALKQSPEQMERAHYDAFHRARRFATIFSAIEGEERVRKVLEIYPALRPPPLPLKAEARTIAMFAGMVRETVSRILADLRRDGG